MLDKLAAVAARFAELESKCESPEVFTDAAAYTALMKEYRKLEPTVTLYRAYNKALSELKDARELFALGDPDLREMAQAECHLLEERAATLLNDLKIQLLPRDENDDKNVIVEIRAGAGGEEAALFVAVLYRMYTMYAESVGFKTSPLSANETELGGYREITFMVEGEGAYSRFKFESGVHRVQRVPVTESQGRIQTSTVTVAVLPEAEEIDVQINPADIIIESCKSSGAGGQHINKTESAVRLTHKPSGIVVECQEERSQFKNRDKAMKMLRTKLLDIERTARENEIATARRTQVGTGDRSERIRTYNYPQGRVTDHRISLTLYTLDKILNGNIGELIDALITADTALKLQSEQ